MSFYLNYKRILDFCCEAQEEWEKIGRDITAMRRLVERICAKDYASLFSAATSHDVLIIVTNQDATAAHYDCISVSHLTVTAKYWKRRSYFAVCYHPCHRKAEQHECITIDEAERLIDCLALRLIMQRQRD